MNYYVYLNVDGIWHLYTCHDCLEDAEVDFEEAYLEFNSPVGIFKDNEEGLVVISERHPPCDLVCEEVCNWKKEGF